MTIVGLPPGNDPTRTGPSLPASGPAASRGIGPAGGVPHGSTGKGLANLVFDRWFPALLLVPLVVLLAVLAAFPASQLVPMSLSSFGFSGGEFRQQFVGLANFQRVLSDRDLGVIVLNTLIFVVASVVIEFLLALALAVAVNREGRAVQVLKAIFTLPILVPPLVIGTVWRLMYNPDIGIINQVLRGVGLPAQNWLTDGRYALPAVIAVDVWHWTSFVFLILFAGLQSIPREPLEAAEVDGASPWQIFRFVTIPLLQRVMVVAIVFRTVFAFKVFDEIYLLTSGGPGNATEVLSLYIQRLEFKFSDFGYGATLSLLTIALVVVALLLSQRYLSVEGADR